MTTQSSDSILANVVLETRTYRNEELGSWIDIAFETEEQRVAAWRTAFHIGDMFPEVKEKIRGNLIDFDTQEETWESL